MTAWGSHKLRSGDNAEDHLYNPQTIIALREATHSGSYERFKEYTALVDDERKPHTLRGLIDFNFKEDGGIPLSEVEPASKIVKRFKNRCYVLRLNLRRSSHLYGDCNEPLGR